MSSMVVSTEEKSYLYRLKSLRLMKNMTQQDVADLMDMDYTTYGKIEKGVSKLDVDRAFRLAQIFGISISEFLEPDIHSEMNMVHEPAPGRYKKKSGPTTIIINIGADGKNSPGAERFLQRLGKAFADDDDEDY